MIKRVPRETVSGSLTAIVGPAPGVSQTCLGVDAVCRPPHVDRNPLRLVLTTSLNELIVGMQQRLAEQLPAADQNGWIAGRPVTITPLDQQTIELVFHGVPQVSEAEVRAVRRVLEMSAFCSVSPESAGTLRVTFLCHVP